MVRFTWWRRTLSAKRPAPDAKHLTPGVSRRKQGLSCMGTLIPLAPAPKHDLTTIYGEVLQRWITQAGRSLPT